ncbi:MAG TPA: DegT/DnrJ/EryC1/StrS family aminotransferase [Candidatus Saccharimonadia bacterium]|nr:DegT/DnrJ/EryC1/StrS family aminotransferase [Candidatus Saccharimonadia bacterium]
MKLLSFSASFHDYELDLNYYHGKDIIHEGCLLRIDPEYSWERINGKIRNKIRKAQKLDTVIKRVKGTPEEIKQFRTVWFDANDETLPQSLEKDEVMYLTYLNDELVGGLILTPSSPTVLYMHNLGSSQLGKRENIPALTLWHAVEDLKDTKWEYIDVGVSFRPTLYNFFKNWQTDSYPIIFSPPQILPSITLNPFRGSDIVTYKEDVGTESLARLSEYFGKQFTVLPGVSYALRALLQHLALPGGSNVALYKTFSEAPVLAEITATIDMFATIQSKVDDDTKAVVVVHQYGYPYEKLDDLRRECTGKGIPLIEVCPAISDGKGIGRPGTVSDYAIFSLPQILPMQYGAIIKGLVISDEENWENYKLLDYFKRQIIATALVGQLQRLDEAKGARHHNWQYIADLFRRDGFEVVDTLSEVIYPWVLRVRMSDAKAARDRYEQFGVETEATDDILCVPIHQNLSIGELDYIYGVFRGKLNLSSNYQRGGKK